MGLLQKACETYDTFAHLAGVEVEGREMLAPLFHTMVRANLEIVLDSDGRFITARAVDKKEEKIAIPVTEASAGRTRPPCAHPLSDGLAYLAPYHMEKHRLYLEQLSRWTSSPYSHPKLRAILKYIEGQTILQDLSAAGLIELKNGEPENEKLMVRWTVNGLGEESGPCWSDQKLIRSFIDYYTAEKEGTEPVLCMITGELGPPAVQHPKGVVSLNGNAKLISTNDEKKKNFIYRGRFDNPAQAATVGCIASQKAHGALRWLVANQSVTFGSRAFLCWNPQGYQIPQVTGSMRRRGKEEQRAANVTEYRQQLRRALAGWKEELPAEAGVVIASFDAATTGRLAVTYYGELQASDFLQRLHDWEERCCWENGVFGIQSPSLVQIVKFAFGTLRKEKLEVGDKLLRQQIQRLVACRVDCAKFPFDIERKLVERASNLMLYEDSEKNRMRRELLFVACAVVRSYRFDHFKEEWDMVLDRENTDRSYLFGRLLAVAECVERSTYDKEEAREPNAVRRQKAFSLCPGSVWRTLEEQLLPYYRRLPPELRQHYRELTEEILSKLPDETGVLNRKLEDTYLLGYYCQKVSCKAETGK